MRQCLLGVGRYDRVTSTRNAPFDRSDSREAHPDADRECHHQGDAAAEVAHDCRQAAVESRDHPVVAPRADQQAAYSAASLVCQLPDAPSVDGRPVDDS